MRRLIILMLLFILSLADPFSIISAKDITGSALPVWSVDNSSSVAESTNTHNRLWSPTKNNPFPLNVSNTLVAVCFSPGGQCTQHIIDMIKQAKHAIRVQAFSFTSRPIANALVAAYRKGIVVTVILDKSNPCEARHRPATCGKKHRIGNTQITKLMQAGIPIYIDYVMNIAHNKVIIIDDNTTLTGSFNFTYAAENNNAENIIFINSEEIATAYISNFNYRLSHSATLSDYYCHILHCCELQAGKQKLSLNGCIK